MPTMHNTLHDPHRALANITHTADNAPGAIAVITQYDSRYCSIHDTLLDSRHHGCNQARVYCKTCYLHGWIAVH
jgi:hypothetical protein